MDIIDRMIRFFNTLSGSLEEFRPLKEGEVRLYTCGPTVYDYPHIGNYRAYIFEDLLKRFLLLAGFKVIHVMNITDVDDKTIKGAARQGLSLQEYTSRYIEAFFEDLKTLRIMPADIYPRATEHIPDMVRMVRGLLDKGCAYYKEGSVYFSIQKFPAYGRLAKIDLAELKAGARVDSDEYEKESVHDFALWKKAKEGEPFWETELGAGRPGWHIECSAMSTRYLGPSIDIHCGGIDNIFPHHENEIAQSEAYYGQKFVNYWLHCHHLVVDGEKMSKSKGNFYTLRDLLARGLNPVDLRFFLLSTHYRKMLNFTFDGLEQARASRQRVLDFVYELEHRTLAPGAEPEIQGLAEKVLTDFKESLADDLNISAALAVLFDFIREINSRLSRDLLKQEDAVRVLRTVEEIDRVLAILQERKEEALPPELLEKIELRQWARKEKNFALADAIREELRQQGIMLEDTKEGVRWKRIK
ncbi:MAG: Cysteinyl-tRNA synthetase [Candidatus Saccharicenans subterraneus]|uniref:Cysteine--tRNA ligase n=1 Tax=Candidatus Saccharicenans subterraneus TaxID=2508984 RepID=A0A3E2BN11_9BACT|nr:MAG: Cysteinyl-tRNA synthetase [Candidatus Saccharicenans subterraneum]